MINTVQLHLQDKVKIFSSMLKFSFFLIVVPLQRFLICDQALAKLCQVYPSEYTYHFASVQSFESASANCREYPPGLHLNIFTEQFIHCNGTQLKLTDSNLGSEQYISSDYYEWSASTSTRQLLFIFQTRVNLTTITLHYYIDSDRGLPRLRFFAVPDDFDVWDAPAAVHKYKEVAAVSPGGEQAGPRNVSIEFNVNTKKILLLRFSSALIFAVSEVEFSICPNIYNVTTTAINDMLGTTSGNANSHIQEVSPNNEFATTYSHTNTKKKSELSTVAVHTSSETQPILLTSALVLGTIIVLTVILIVTIALALFFRKSAQQKTEFDSSYATICRGTTQKLQPQSHHNANDLYDQIQLSPLTGQTEVISIAETENINRDSQYQPTSDTEQHKEATLHPTSLSLKEMKVEKSTPEQLNYAVVHNKQKRNKYKGKANATEKESAQSKEYVVRNIEELYTAVQKKPNSSVTEGEEVVPSTPPHTVKDLYTAVVKKPKCTAAEDTPTVPPHTVEELYTAVAKKFKERESEEVEETPLIPPHTVEELYTAVEKKPKRANEENAPPIPPYYNVEYCT